jgi:hypothetical protein
VALFVAARKLSDKRSILHLGSDHNRHRLSVYIVMAVGVVSDLSRVGDIPYRTGLRRQPI